jgi:hypothetical protein|nr:MAG TPA: hypothetical protein [Caudoviricetes sp.]
MAIKFSELRGLLKDTNINTVKMSDPVYGIQMEKITYKNYYNFSEQRKSISFKNIHYLKKNNQLYLLNQILPFNIRINFILYANVFRNTRILVTKKSIFKFYQLVINEINEWYKKKWITNTLYSCFYLNNTNNNILNPRLTKIVLSDYENHIKYFPRIEANKYYNSSWHILNEIKKIQYSDNEQHMFYDYEIIDRDVNLNSSVLFYTSPMTNNEYANITVYLGYKPNDNIKERYKALQMYIYHYLNIQRDEIINNTFSFDESYFNEKSGSPTLNFFEGGIYFLEDLR